MDDAGLIEWAATFRAPNPGSSELPAHHDGCLGCGVANPHGHQLAARREGDAVVAGCTFDARHVGAPGVVHGGAVATVLDELFGFALCLVQEIGVTGSLTVEYLRPVVLHRRYALRAEIARRDGRKIELAARMADESGRACAEARALFVAVDLDHFRNVAGR